MKDPDGWHLGLTSERYETSGRGPSTISSGIDDPGGMSYGSYQLSSSKGTLKEYLDKSAYSDDFKRLTPTSSSFNMKWRELANSDPKFGEEQHDFIKVTHYDKQVERLKADGLDLTSRGASVKDALWSTSVQYRGFTKGIFEKGLTETFGEKYKLSDLSDKDIVIAVQDYKSKHNDTLFSSSPATTRAHILDRINKEKVDLIDLADGKVVDHGLRHSPVHMLKQGARGDDVRTLQADLAVLGYTSNKGEPLESDGDFGPGTKAAVEAFQRDSSLKVDGVAGYQTLGAMQAQREVLERGTPALAPALEGLTHVSDVSRPGAGINPYNDPSHPDYGLHAELRERIPNASDNRIAECTAACHMSGIKSGQLGQIFLRGEEALVLLPNGMAGREAIVPLVAPAPPFEQSVLSARAFDQQQAQDKAQVPSHQAQISQQQAQMMGGAGSGGPGF